MNRFSFRILALWAVAAATALPQTKPPAKKWTPPKTSWGDPDLQGVWTSDNFYGVPFERPAQYGNREYLTDEEYAAKAKETDYLATSVQAGVYPKAGYWARQKGVDAKAVPTNWTEYARRAPRQTSLIVDPPNGRTPPLTAYGESVRAAQAAARKPRPESWLDISIYDRCITRGVAGSMFPVIYGNGSEIVQMPGLVAIRYEMIHETRLIPTDGRPHAPADVRTYMGDPRGHWEGNTLVVETTNFLGGTNGFGGNGGGLPYSDETRLVERFTRLDDRTVHYQITINDPKTYTAPWTAAFEITHEPGYRLFEYACHEGNYAMRNSLSAARAEEATEAAKKK
ncbi:MAG TPA: hypothetical protein VHY84_24085 [Bryobacteraceae bacterium]|jgi:hypothetical protein|nr:hypothetical protein [Bryobacteraceae bacterium]